MSAAVQRRKSATRDSKRSLFGIRSVEVVFDVDAEAQRGADRQNQDQVQEQSSNTGLSSSGGGTTTSIRESGRTGIRQLFRKSTSKFMSLLRRGGSASMCPTNSMDGRLHTDSVQALPTSRILNPARRPRHRTQTLTLYQFQYQTDPRCRRAPPFRVFHTTPGARMNRRIRSRH